ncbi:MAG: putative signal transducing protein [Candidatus Hydrogenedentota bacterium]
MNFDAEGRPYITIRTCNNEQEAAVIASFLAANGVNARTSSEVPHAILPLTVGRLALVDIQVEEEDAERASRILHEYETDFDNPPEHGGAPG